SSAAGPAVGQSLGPVSYYFALTQPHFEWRMKERFGFDTLPNDGLVDYDYSPCYLNPESDSCPTHTHPWVVTFDATGSSGSYPPFTYDWVISGDPRCTSVTTARIDHTA